MAIDAEAAPATVEHSMDDFGVPYYDFGVELSAPRRGVVGLGAAARDRRRGNDAKERTARLGALAAGGGLLISCAAGLVCAAPLAAIALGVGGLGWLTQYVHLRVPAMLATAALLLLGYYLVYRRGAACSNQGRRRSTKVWLWVATVFAAAVNAFEFLILPALG